MTERLKKLLRYRHEIVHGSSREVEGRDIGLISDSCCRSSDVGRNAGEAEGVRGEEEAGLNGNEIEEGPEICVEGSTRSEIDIDGTTSGGGDGGCEDMLSMVVENGG